MNSAAASPRMATSCPTTCSCSPWARGLTASGTSEGVLTYRDGRDGPSYRLLLHQLREGRVDRLAFVKPAGPTWPLPLYDLALLTAADCAAHGRSEVELSLVTPEQEPLGIFGSPASAAIRGAPPREPDRSAHQQLRRSESSPGGWTSRRASGACPLTASSPCLASSAHDYAASPADATGSCTPTLTAARRPGRRLRRRRRDGLPDQAGWPGRPAGRRRRRGDRRLGGRRHRSAAVPAGPARGPARPAAPRAICARTSAAAQGDDSIIAGEALWWPPNKLSGRYLAPYLSSQVGEAADVMPQGEHAIPVETPLDPMTPAQAVRRARRPRNERSPHARSQP